MYECNLCTAHTKFDSDAVNHCCLLGYVDFSCARLTRFCMNQAVSCLLHQINVVIWVPEQMG